MVTREMIRQLPKVELHDHLDGSVRASTIVELAREQGVELPARDPAALAEWFHRGADRKSLKLYLEGFGVTVSVMQTEEALERVAREAIEDLAADHVMYAEVRFAPMLHLGARAEPGARRARRAAGPRGGARRDRAPTSV